MSDSDDPSGKLVPKRGRVRLVLLLLGLLAVLALGLIAFLHDRSRLGEFNYVDESVDIQLIPPASS